MNAGTACRLVRRQARSLFRPDNARQLSSTTRRMEGFKTLKDNEESPAETLQRQRYPLTGFYQLMMDTTFTPSSHPAYYPPINALPPAAQTTAPSEEPENAIADAGKPKIPETAKPELIDSKLAQQEALKARARVVFGSRLTGPQRWVELNKKAEVIAGVRVPPKPLEPDTCCMSGCVNCVWDIFREDIENWSAAKAQAQAALDKLADEIAEKRPGTKRKKAVTTTKEKKTKKSAATADVPETTSSDVDGGRAIVNSSMWEGYDDLPVGIRQFMETEKGIKMRKRERGEIDV